MKKILLGVVILIALFAAIAFLRVTPRAESPARRSDASLDLGAPPSPAAHRYPEASDSATRNGNVRSTPPARRLDPSLTPREVTRAVTGFAAATIREAMRDETRFADLAACRQAGDDCAVLEAEALAAVLAWPLRDELFRGSYGLEGFAADWGRDTLRERLAESVEDAYARNRDRAERVATLALLQAVDVASPRPLDATVYAGLAERAPAEAGLLLEQFERAPLDAKPVLDEIWVLATDSEVPPALRVRAVRTLGIAAAPADLGRAIQLLDEDGLLNREAALASVAPALVRCGAPCADELAPLARSENPAARLAALTAVGRLGPAPLRARLLEQIRVAFQGHERLNALERDQLAYLTRHVAR